MSFPTLECELCRDREYILSSFLSGMYLILIGEMNEWVCGYKDEWMNTVVKVQYVAKIWILQNNVIDI